MVEIRLQGMFRAVDIRAQGSLKSLKIGSTGKRKLGGHN